MDVAGGVSLSVLEVLECRVGRDRAIAVWRRASSRVLVGLDVRGSAGCDSGVVVVVKVEGSILPMNVQRFLLGAVGGESVGSFGELSVGSDFVVERAGRDCRFDAVGVLPPDKPCDEDELTRPSNPRNRLAAGIWLSLRMIRRRRPGAG